jgi:hypothetical protein
VKTFHLFQDAGIRETFAAYNFDFSVIPDSWEIEAPPDGVVSRTLRGAVELKPL